MASSLLPVGDAFFRALDSTSTVMNGALMYTYEAGTSTPLASYSDEDLLVANTNPVVADAGGLFGPMFGLPQAYKLELQTSAGVVIATVDEVFPAQPASSANVDITGTAGVAFTAGQVGYLSDGSDSLTAGQWYLADADETYASSTPQIGFAVAAIGAGESGLIRTAGKVTGLSGLTPGALYYISTSAGAITATKPGNARFVGQAESTTVLVVQTNPPAPSVDVLEVQIFS